MPAPHMQVSTGSLTDTLWVCTSTLSTTLCLGPPQENLVRYLELSRGCLQTCWSLWLVFEA